MDPTQERMEALFEAARQLTSFAERAAYLDRACPDDPVLREQVEAMLADEASAETFFGSIDSLGESVREVSERVGEGSRVQIAEGPGTVIGRYRLLEEIGEGGFGIVYLAEQREPVVRQVALKVLKPGLDTREVVGRFESERQALAMMDHPHIARVLDGGATDTGRPYFVMDLVPGRSITEFCDANHFSIRDRLELFVKVCRAVQHAHQKGIIHRDLKPSNVLIVQPESGEPAEPKVIDFGIAKALDQRLTLRTMVTRRDQLLGTPEYMSPEQAGGSGIDVDTRSDIYSLGAMLYELLTGTPPFEREQVKRSSWEEVRRMIRETEPPRPSTRLRTLGAAVGEVGKAREAHPVVLTRLLEGDLDWVVMKALHKERERRYDTAAALAQDLERYLNDEPVTARAPSRLYRSRKFVMRHRAGLAVAAALAGLVAVGGMVSTWQMVRARKAERLAGQRLEEVDEERQQAESVLAFLVEAFRRPDPMVDGRAVTVAEVLDRAATNLTGKLQDAPARKATVLQALAETYHGLGLDDPAERLASQALALRQQVLGAEDPDTLRSMSYVAGFRMLQGRLDEAEELLNENFELCQRVLGPTHTNTIEARIILQVCYSRQQRLEDAATFGRKTYELALRALGPKARLTLTAMVNLGSTYQRQQRLDEAKSLYETALEVWRSLDRNDDPEALDLMSNLGSLLYTQGHLMEASILLQQVLDTQRRVLGPQHPHTLPTLYNLAETYRKRSDLAKSQSLWEEVFAQSREVLGLNHADTEFALIVLSHLHERQGDLEGAIALRFDHIKLVFQWAERYTQLFALIDRVQAESRKAVLLDRFLECCTNGFAEHSDLSGKLDNSLHYTAARAAARAASLRTGGADSSNTESQTRLRRKAIEWLRADLALWTAQLRSDGPLTWLRMEDALGRWREAEALAPIRDPTALETLSEVERRECADLWSHVANRYAQAMQQRRAMTRTLLAKGSQWAYLENGSDPGNAWRRPEFDDAEWARGRGPFGYHDLELSTELAVGLEPEQRPITMYFRTSFTVTQTADCSRLILWLRRNDGAVVYLNGHELLRDNLIARGPVDPRLLAGDLIIEHTEPTYHLHEMESTLLRLGTNTVAVEVHQAEWRSPDMAFDLELLALRSE